MSTARHQLSERTTQRIRAGVALAAGVLSFTAGTRSHAIPFIDDIATNGCALYASDYSRQETGYTNDPHLLLEHYAWNGHATVPGMAIKEAGGSYMCQENGESECVMCGGQPVTSLPGLDRAQKLAKATGASVGEELCNTASIWDLQDTTDGLKTLTMKTTSAFGEHCYADAQIILDRQPPRATMRINLNYEITPFLDNQLIVHVADDGAGIDAFRVRNEGGAWSDWMAVETWQYSRYIFDDFVFPWTLAPGSGLHRVYLEVRDRFYDGTTFAPRTFVTSDDITVDLTPPTGTLVLDDGKQFTNSEWVQATASYTGLLTYMQLKNEDQSAYPGSGVRIEPTRHRLSQRDTSKDPLANCGPRTVTARLFSTAYRQETFASDTIYVDQQAPEATLAIEPRASLTSPTVQLTITARDWNPASGTQPAWVSGVSQMRFKNESSGTWSAWEPFATTKAWTLQTSDLSIQGGYDRQVLVNVRDAAGNNAVASATTLIIVDTTPPSGYVMINAGALYTTSTAATLRLGATDIGGGLESFAYKVGGTGTYSAWEPYTTSKSVTLPAGEGPKQVFVKFRDFVGHESAEASDSIVLDTLPPTGTINISNGAPTATTRAVALNLSATDDGSGVAFMRFRNGPSGSWSGWQTYSTTAAWTLPGNDGEKTVIAQFADRTDHLSAELSDTIQLVTAVDGTVTINNGDVYTNSRTVTLALTASNSATGNIEMCVNDDTPGATCSWEPFAAAKSYSLGDGTPKLVRAKYRNKANPAVESSFSDTIIVDTTPPNPCMSGAGAVKFNNGSPQWVFSQQVVLTLCGEDTAGSGVESMRLANNCTNWTAWEPYATTRDWVLPLTSAGEQKVCVEFRDKAGNVSTCTGSTTNDHCWNVTKFDGVSPSMSITIPGGTNWITTRSPELTVAASDVPSGTSLQVRFNNGGGWADPDDGWQAYDASSPVFYNLTQPEGRITIVGEVRDRAGNVRSAQFSTILDVTPPKGSITIDSGAVYARSRDVVLSVPAQDEHGLDYTKFRNDSDAYPNTGSPYRQEVRWVLSPGDGTKTVSVLFQDGPGNTFEASDSIILDTTAPVGTVAINNGAPFTRIGVVNLTLTAADANGPITMRIRNEGSEWGPSQPFATTTTTALAPGDGLKTIMVELMDAAGNSTVISDSIVVDSVRPTTAMVVADGAPMSANNAVTLDLTAQDDASGVSTMRFGNEDGTWSNWEPFAPTKTWYLSMLDETKTVYVQVKDAVGNIVQVAKTIVLDRTPPTGSVIVAGGATCTASPSVTLAITASDGASGVSGMRFSTAAGIWGDWEALAESRTIALPAGDGPKTILTQIRDSLGNTTEISRTIILDTTRPSGVVSINNGASCTASREVTLGLQIDDGPCGPVTVRFANGAGAWTDWEPLTAARSWQLPAGDASHVVKVEARDGVGNVGVFEPGITFDSAGPVGAVLIDAGAPSTHSGDVSLMLAASDPCGVAEMRLRNDGGSWGAWQAMSSSASWTLGAGFGFRAVGVEFRDGLGNSSIEYFDQILVSQLCASAAECPSGFCSDGVCCDSACNGLCERCDLAASTGTCSPIPDKMDPDEECAGDTAPCGGVCDGNRACSFPNLDAECQTASCALGIVTPAKHCNGSGECAAPTPDSTSCGIYTCDSDGRSCRSTCSSDAHCLPGLLCYAGTCVVAYPSGAPCAQGLQCESGVCAGGRCCTGACTTADGTCGGMCDSAGQCTYPTTSVFCGVCKTCDGLGACLGTPADDSRCGDVSCAGLDNSCATYGAIVTNHCRSFGQCKGAPDDCTIASAAAAGTVCAATTCAAGSETRHACDGQGVCQTSTVSCSPYVCADATSCLNACLQDTDCIAGHGCNTVLQSCGRLPGDTCSDDQQCQSGFCTDGVCCGSRCDGLCERCGASGTCAPVPDGEDPANECAGTGTCGGTCNGALACKFPGTDVSCGLCTACDGKGACGTKPQADPACGTLACSALSTACRSFLDDGANRCSSLGECARVDVLHCTAFEDAADGAPCACGDAGAGQCGAGTCVCGTVDAGLDAGTDVAADAPVVVSDAAPAIDSEAPADAASIPDARDAEPGDASGDRKPAANGGGCGCQTATGGLPSLALVLLVLLATCTTRAPRGRKSRFIRQR